jgi:hypothetical protein
VRQTLCPIPSGPCHPHYPDEQVGRPGERPATPARMRGLTHLTCRHHAHQQLRHRMVKLNQQLHHHQTPVRRERGAARRAPARETGRSKTTTRERPPRPLWLVGAHLGLTVPWALAGCGARLRPPQICNGGGGGAVHVGGRGAPPPWSPGRQASACMCVDTNTIPARAGRQPGPGGGGGGQAHGVAPGHRRP